MQLHGRGSPRKYGDARAVRVALEIDQDVERIVADVPRGLIVGKRANVAPMREGLPQSLPHRAAVIAIRGVSERLDASLVVEFEQARHEMRGGMVVKVGRQIAHAQAIPTPRDPGRRNGRGQRLP